jgi:Curli production assembly/transport component CsgG.
MKHSSDQLSPTAKPCLIVFGAALLTCVTGCLMPNPASLAIAERDKAVYVDKDAVKQEEEAKSRVAVIVSHGDYREAKPVAKSLDSELTSVISNLAFFEIAERSNLSVLVNEEVLKSLSEDENNLPEIPNADYIITASISIFNMVRHINTQSNEPYIQTKLGVDFRFYEIESKRVILTRNIKKYFNCDANIDSVISEAVDVTKELVHAFCMELGSRYAPPARVLETRGEAKVACISMGTNYGLMRNTKLEFFEYVDNSDVIEGATREPSIVARGTAIDSDLKSAWIRVDDHKNVAVKRGHYVRIRLDQPREWRDIFRLN